MKLSLSQLKKSSGFTLIELLVVIAIIGILAAALIATLDPLEQIRKANDTTKKNMAAEVVSATTRYFGSHQYFPWDTLAPIPCADPAAAGTQLSVWDCVGGGVLPPGLLVTDGELKTAFLDSSLTIRQSITVANTGTAPLFNILACFVPESKSAQADQSAGYDASTFAAGCPFGVNSGCMWCAQ